MENSQDTKNTNKPVHRKGANSKDSSPSESEQTEHISSAETRAVVTPFAFTVSPRLLGLPLATPNRRGLAILIDIFLIGVLTGLSSLFLAGFVALTFFKAGNRLKQQKRFNLIRLTLRGSAAFLIFAIIFTILGDLDNYDKPALSQQAQVQKNEDSIAGLLILTAKLADINCEKDNECLRKYAEGTAIAAIAMEIPVKNITDITTKVVSEKQWSEDTKSLFMDTFTTTLSKQQSSNVVETDETAGLSNAVARDETDVLNKANEQPSKIYSGIEWIKGAMSDLGLSLGWAAVYFSVFTAWWQGQTIGKKLVGIEVVKLDGNYPSLWESFGRYGGYAAGLTTGLLGFLQIYWDPNRQAIQDKISETLVLRCQQNAQS